MSGRKVCPGSRLWRLGRLREGLDLGGWESLSEYLAAMVPRLGTRAVAQALGVDVADVVEECERAGVPVVRKAPREGPRRTESAFDVPHKVW